MSEDHAAVLCERLHRVDLPIIAYIGAAKLTLRDLLDMKEGDVLQLNRRTDDDIVLEIGDEYRYFAKAGKKRGHNAVKITRIISGPDDV